MDKSEGTGVFHCYSIAITTAFSKKKVKKKINYFFPKFPQMSHGTDSPLVKFELRYHVR